MADQKTIEALKRVIRKQIAEVKNGESPKSMHEMAVELAKTASAGLKSIEALKSKVKLPSGRAQNAVDMHISALEKLFNDMWQTPLSYLDNTPDDVVSKRRSDLDDREASLVDHNVQESVGRCNCENSMCKSHEAAACPMPAGSRRAMYVGSLCDECAANMPAEYMLESSKDDSPGQNPNLLTNPVHCDTCGATYDTKIHVDCPTCCNSDVREWANKLRSTKKAV